MIIFPYRKIHCGLHFVAAAFCFTLLSNVKSIADDTLTAKTEKTAKTERLISLVVLLHEPSDLNEHTLGTLVNKALGVKHGHDEKDGNFVVAKPPYFLIKLKSGSYVVNLIPERYIPEHDKLIDGIKQPELRKALAGHHAWASIDWASAEEPKDIRRSYQDMGKIIAALAGHRALAIYNPEIDDFALYNEAAGKALSSDDPLQAFASSSDDDDGGIVSIRNDDPRLLAAEAEAKKGWHDFVNAFREKAGSEFAVKGRIAEGDNAEFLWLIVDSIDDMKVHGQLDNQPSTVMNLKMGQDLHIPVADVDDWIYLNKEKKPVGGFTIKVFDQLAQPKPKH